MRDREGAGEWDEALYGILFFLAFTCALSWTSAWALAEAFPSRDGTVAAQLLSSTLSYAAAMGWQPVVAVWVIRRRIDGPGFVDAGLAPPRTGWMVVGVLAPLALAGLAVLLAGALASFELWTPSRGRVALAPAAAPSAAGALAATAALLGALVLVGVQSLSEEIGWRGFLLTRMMQRFGPWRGLLLHGAAWGVWYGPILIAGGGASGLRSAAFLITCVLLGTLFGWLRLASRSVIPGAIANSALTLGAGLPFILQGFDLGLRAAPYWLPGWLVMALTIALLLATRARRTIATP